MYFVGFYVSVNVWCALNSVCERFEQPRVRSLRW